MSSATDPRPHSSDLPPAEYARAMEERRRQQAERIRQRARANLAHLDRYPDQQGAAFMRMVNALAILNPNTRVRYGTAEVDSGPTVSSWQKIAIRGSQKDGEGVVVQPRTVTVVLPHLQKTLQSAGDSSYTFRQPSKVKCALNAGLGLP